MTSAVAAVAVQTVIAAPPETVWPYLTVGELVSKWFADSAGIGREDDHFRLEFGDGDYFAGVVTERLEGRVLGMRWRFMGIGPTYEIRLELSRCAMGTRVTVSDRGASSESEAESLREGWTDFLARLERCVSTGRVTRYEWSECIGTSALVGGDGRQTLAVLSQEPWWVARFQDAAITLSSREDRVVAEIHDPRWQGASTRAEITTETRPEGTCLHVRHEGWTRLPVEMRLVERRRAAGVWAGALAQIEADAAN